MLKRNTSSGLLPRLSSLSMERSKACALLFLLAVTTGLARTSRAQAIPVAERTGRIDIYGGYTFTKPDYAPQKNNGFFVGGTYMFRRFNFGQPGITVRYSRTTGAIVKETFAGGGLDLRYKVKRTHPFITAAYGIGGIDVPIIGYSDSGTEFLLGGGVDVPVIRFLSVRGEFDYGFFHIAGKGGTSEGELHLTPASVNVGVVYHFR